MIFVLPLPYSTNIQLIIVWSLSICIAVLAPTLPTFEQVAVCSKPEEINYAKWPVPVVALENGITILLPYFMQSVSYYTPALKSSENLWFSDVFKGYRKTSVT